MKRIALLFAASVAGAQAPPVIDMHMHALGTAGTTAMLAAMDSLNVRAAIFIGPWSSLASERGLAPAKLIPALTFPCDNGRLPTSGVNCFGDAKEFPDLADLRAAIVKGDVRALGEINAQYLGIAPNDVRLEPYYALAEELDIPVGIHLGIGAPGVAYPGPGFPPSKSPRYSGVAGDPRLLESVLVRHPRLRMYVMHAAWPYLDDMTYMLYMHPQLYVDVSVLQYAIPRPAYYRYLRELVDAGFASRIMFGSDGSARRLRDGINAIMEADFLTPEQKRAILHDNAAKFLRM
ncbi:MAG: amidohydrolase family protein [Gemmatimonadaceae bacterium]